MNTPPPQRIPSNPMDPVVKLAGQGRWREARERYGRLLKKAGRDWRAYYQVGMLEASGGDADRAVRALRKALEFAPSELQVLVNLSQLHLHKGDPAAALQLLEPVAARLRDAPAALKLYGTALLEVGRQTEAAEILETALAKGEDAATLNNLALLYRATDDPARAATMLERAAKLDRGVEILGNLGNTYLSLGRRGAARAIFDEIAQCGGADPRAHRAVAIFLRDSGDLKGAIQAAQRAVVAVPDHAPSWTLLAEVLDRDSRLEDTLQAAGQGLFLSPGDPYLTALCGRALRRLKRDEDAVARLRPVASSNSAPGPHDHRVAFELAQSLDALKDHAGAFEWFEKANRTQLAQTGGSHADPKKPFAEIAALKAAFATVPEWRKPVEDVSDPVFLVGFPRSGTTLLDQVLDAHPGVQVLEERPLISSLAARLTREFGNYPGPLSGLTAEQSARLRQTYLSERDRFLKPAPGAVYIDKMPLNIVHAGLILRIFPGARFILALRHPCDVCLSCLMQSFSLNHSMAVFCSLPDTVRFYHEVFALWRQYLEVLKPSYVQVRYEDMTRDLQGAATPVLRFLGLEWDEKLARFHEHARARGHIATPSYAQVTQPLYGHAVARWKRYGPVMEEVARELEPEISWLGYDE